MEKSIRNMANAELIDFYSDKRFNGMDFSLMRKEMEKAAIEPDMISMIIRYIDGVEHSKLKRDNSIYSSKNLIYSGIGTLLFGLLFTGFTLLKFNESYILMYGAIFGGIGMIISGVAKRNQE